MSGFQLSYRHTPVYSLSAQQNEYRLFAGLRLNYPEDEEGNDAAVLRDLTVRLECEQDLLEPQVWQLDQIAPGQQVFLPEREIRFAHDYLFQISDETSLSFKFSVFTKGSEEPLLTRSETITVLPANFWGGESRQPELLAAFVKPNGAYVDSLVRQVAEIMEANGYGRAADGYQSNTRERPYFMAAALWQVVVAQRIAYVSPPPSFAHRGQMIRLASDISNRRNGACLDLSVLFASCLELVGLNTVIALTEGHAFVGVWLIDSSFPLLTNDDPMDLRKRVDAKDMVLFESTMVTSSNATFLQACDQGRAWIDEDKEEEFVYAIDIKQARNRQIKPLSTAEEKQEEVEAKDEGVGINLPPAPPLPPVRADEKIVAETPDTRIDAWQRKLLDLSKRNILLNFRDRSPGIRIFCPDIGRMEDMLADGATFNFITAEQSDLSSGNRNEESFRLTTGNNLHKQYALEQLDGGTLVANMPQNKFSNSAVNLLRKAKNDLEEGGANTLFLALGMLRWKEYANDSNSYKAPLVLIPVELVRRSAGARIKLKQLADADPIFNLTLIEFLDAGYSINLAHLRDELPEDDSGVDVARVWNDIRYAISEQEGFEVVEECVIASFSFAKYLMWNDLTERIDDLKQNPFVHHMVERPREAYSQQSSFIDRKELDQKIDPAEMFTPLNCDSSQLVAVEASARTQDFVLEGPPGTGKSETIANMIAHNLAKGRKVLFVAEKIAALQVVYRRLQKIGLDRFCLELHSSKANKRAVLEQLRLAVARPEEGDNNQWQQDANRIRELRDSLNDFVQALHEPSVFGISPREAIAHAVRYGKEHQLDLGWPSGIGSAPISGREGAEELLAAAGSIGSAYEGIVELDVTPFRSIVATTEWSHAWQSSAVGLIDGFTESARAALQVASEFAAQFDIEAKELTMADVNRLHSLVRLTKLAESHSLDFAVRSGGNERLQRLQKLAAAKEKFDGVFKSIGHGVTVEIIAVTPISEWLQKAAAAAGSWWKPLFAKIAINNAARKCGYEKFRDLSILNQIRDAKVVYDEIKGLSQEFERYDIWRGWDSKAEHLKGKLHAGRQAMDCIRQAVGLVDDPAPVLAAVKVKLVDGRDYISGSKLDASKVQFDDAFAQLQNRVASMKEHGLQLADDQPLAIACEHYEQLRQHQNKLRNWLDWVKEREKARQLGLMALCDALESGRILPNEAANQVKTAFYAWLAPNLIDASDLLRQFRGHSHDHQINMFRNLDAQVAEATSDYVSALLSRKVPDISSAENQRHFSTLSRELQKRTRHKPVRSLFKSMGERLLDLCPCMMMSPLSVAQFLPSDFKAFDVVIFDEASQVTTWDAVGAIARGKNVIVVGDPKQMPPTNFFSTAADSDDPDEEDLESILDQALAAGLPHLRLMGHYRSRHETLIAFSNSKYYENALITYPSSDTKESAVTLQRVNGVYAKGSGRNNPDEAKAVVAAAVRHLKDHASKRLSLGIVTLNTDQQRTIEDLLDDARRKHPEIEKFFHSADDYDPVFVKNLESVQGDERDVIMLSFGYGPTERGGKAMSMNFGPLNKQGGERRLNVAITRATTEVRIFSSFDSHMIDLSRTSATAVEHIRHYLEFAERGPVALAEQSTANHGVDQFDSDFEQSVAWALREKGWNVQTQVGVSRFRVDLGVIHPDKPGRYLAGVECDGATYHGSPSARDRDRIRQAVLENLGWKLVRLWSTDYFLSPNAAIDDIHRELTELLEKDRTAAATMVREEPTAEVVQDAEGSAASDQPGQRSGDDFSMVSDDASSHATAGEDGIWPSAVYYESSHESVLSDMAREILTEQPCITIKALALEVAERHGLSRTSKKQIAHLQQIINKWAGIWRDSKHQPVYWVSPDYVQNVIDWRGISPFGYERDWQEIAHPEAIGLARQAIERQPADPVDYICKELQLRRRHPKTLAEFESWVADAAAMNASGS